MADLKEAHLFPSLQAQQKHWYYCGKVRLLEDVLTPWLRQRSRGSVCQGLDFGAENGVISRSLGAHLQGVSINWDLVDDAFGADSVCCDAEGFKQLRSLPKDQHYDLILAIDVIDTLITTAPFLVPLDNVSVLAGFWWLLFLPMASCGVIMITFLSIAVAIVDLNLEEFCRLVVGAWSIYRPFWCFFSLWRWCSVWASAQRLSPSLPSPCHRPGLIAC